MRKDNKKMKIFQEDFPTSGNLPYGRRKMKKIIFLRPFSDFREFTQ